MQMGMPQMPQHVPVMAPSVSPPLPMPKPPRPPAVPRERKPPAPKRKSDPSYAPSASTSAPKPRNTKSSARARGDGNWEPPVRGKGDSDYEEEVELDVNVTFDMKQELANKIQEFDNAGRIDEILSIIQSSAPQLLGEDGGEVELDIDLLDQRTLLKLYELAVRPIGRGRQLKPKKNKVKGRNRGVDEVAEEERINLLQAQLDAMEGGNGAPAAFPPGTILPDMPAPAPAQHQGGRGDVASSSSEDEEDDASDSDSDNFAPDE